MRKFVVIVVVLGLAWGILYHHASAQIYIICAPEVMSTPICQQYNGTIPFTPLTPTPRPTFTPVPFPDWSPRAIECVNRFCTAFPMVTNFCDSTAPTKECYAQN